MHPDTEYLNLAEKIMKYGEEKEDRTGTGMLELFGPQMEFDLQKGFPLLTTKKVPFRVVAEELFWFISGSTNLKDLLDKNVHIWNGDAYRYYCEHKIKDSKILDYESFIEQSKRKGYDLGPIYGSQWRQWQPAEIVANYYLEEGEMLTEDTIDQLHDVVNSLRDNPNSRRHVVSAWNPGDMKEMALPPCHVLFQFCIERGKLSCKLYQRSGDFFLGVPFNIASYSLLTHLIARTLDLEVGRFIHTLGSAHIYLNHTKQIHKQMQREPKNLPTLIVRNKKNDIGQYSINDIELSDYDPHGSIKGEVSVGL